MTNNFGACHHRDCTVWTTEPAACDCGGTANKSPPQHTVLPWHYDHQTKEIYILDDENEPCDVIADMETFKTPIDKAHTNGQFIARACNSHYELLAALEYFVKENARGRYVMDDVCIDAITISQARAAIAKARGQQ
jgi:hypothetical protein